MWVLKGVTDEVISNFSVLEIRKLAVEGEKDVTQTLQNLLQSAEMDRTSTSQYQSQSVECHAANPTGVHTESISAAQ
eukprot:5258567-Pleurochrysis_carterae.AAC.1